MTARATAQRRATAVVTSTWTTGVERVSRALTQETPGCREGTVPPRMLGGSPFPSFFHFSSKRARYHPYLFFIEDFRIFGRGVLPLRWVRLKTIIIHGCLPREKTLQPRFTTIVSHHSPLLSSLSAIVSHDQPPFTIIIHFPLFVTFMFIMKQGMGQQIHGHQDPLLIQAAAKGIHVGSG